MLGCSSFFITLLGWFDRVTTTRSWRVDLTTVHHCPVLSLSHFPTIVWRGLKERVLIRIFGDDAWHYRTLPRLTIFLTDLVAPPARPVRETFLNRPVLLPLAIVVPS